MKKIMLIVITLIAISSHAQIRKTVIISPATSNFDIARNVPFESNVNSIVYYLINLPQTTSGVCISIRNNNPTNNHPVTIAAYVTNDKAMNNVLIPSTSTIDDRWQATIIGVANNTWNYSGVNPTINALSTSNQYAETGNNVKLAIAISGTTTLAGSPDTYNITASLGAGGSCVGTMRFGEYVRGVFNSGSTNLSSALKSMHLVGGLDSGSVTQALNIDASGRLIVSNTTTGASAQEVQGSFADGAASTAKPVTIGGIDNSGNAQNWQFATNGVPVLATNFSAGDASAANLNGAIWTSNSTGADSGLVVLGKVFNGATYDRMRGDTKGLEVHGTRSGISAHISSTATTLTAVGGSFVAPGASLSIYITDISFSSSAAAGTAADSYPTLKYGTGGTCGTGTTITWGALVTANGNVTVNLSAPIKIPANNEVCWIMSTAGTKVININGFIAP